MVMHQPFKDVRAAPFSQQLCGVFTAGKHVHTQVL